MALVGAVASELSWHQIGDVAGALYIGLGRLQEAIGLEPGIAVGFLMVVPAPLLALVVRLRHPDVAR